MSPEGKKGRGIGERGGEIRPATENGSEIENWEV